MADKTVTIKINAQDNASTTLKKVGASAKTTEKDLDRMGTTGSRSLDKLSKAGAIAGAATTAFIGIMADASRAAAESEISQAKLETAIQDTGHAYEEYAAQIDAASQAALDMSFDDEDAADAITAITTATGDANIAIGDLATVMDVARGRGIDLAAAANIVIAAEQGRVGVLARLGIQLDENATREERMAALQGKYAGQAEAYADTASGAFDRINVSIGNYMEQLGGVAGKMQPILMMLPGLSAGFTAASAAIGGFASVGMLGPVGLVAGAAAAVVGVAKLADYLNTSYSESLGAAVGATDELTASLKLLEDSVVVQKVNAIASPFDAIIEKGEELQAQRKRLTDANNALHDSEQGLLQTQNHAALDAANAQITANEAKIAAIDAEIEALGLNQEAIDKAGKATEALTTIMGFNADARSYALGLLEETRKEYDNGTLSLEQYESDVILISQREEHYTKIMEERHAVAARIIAQMEEYNQVLTGNSQASRDAAKAAWEHRNALASNQSVLDDHQETLLVSAGAANGLYRETENLAGASVHAGAALTDMMEAMRVEQAQAFADALADIQNMAHLSSLSANGMGDAFGAVVGQTNSWKAQAQAVADWASELNALPGVIIDLESYGDIMRENQEIQEDVTRIQTAAAPAMADALEQQENYIDNLSQQSSEMQLVALGWMDQTESAKAMEIATIAASGAMDTYTKNAIEGAANADPVLAAMLSDMGLIEQGANGWVVVDTDDAQSDVQLLTDAINNLTRVFTSILDVQDNASPTINDVAGMLYNLDGQTATTYVDTVYRTSGVNGFGAIGMATGGTIPHAATGRTVLVGEAGPELVNLPGGSQVMSHPASKSRMQNSAGGGNLYFYGPVTLQPAGSDAHAAIYQSAMSGARR